MAEPVEEKIIVATEIKFLEGPQSRWSDFKYALDVFFQFIKGFRTLHFVGPCVTIFGSARFHDDHEYYIKTRVLAGAIARLGFTIMTGGGPGLMEAANRGAKEVGGRSVGCNIVLAHEQMPNAFLDTWVSMKYFFVRKNLLLKYSYAFVVMPGGFGTLDEFFEALTLVQTKKISNFPIVIFDIEFHKQVMIHVELMKQKGTISAEDLSLYLVTDSVEEAVMYIKDNTIVRYGLKPKVKVKPFHWLLERNRIM